jgi:hypothetical protein
MNKEEFHKAIVDSMKECNHGEEGTCFWCKSVKKTIGINDNDTK